ncbi:MAG TPA: ThiF family adenylyltransferase [bacterium]|nr:ThiF family adenylyltransferase [bacterium]
MSFFERTAIIYGPAASARLSRATVALFGLGGVGAAASVDLVRAGVGHLVVTDFDAVQESNLNRLAIGFTDTVGQEKVTVLRDTAHRINPAVIIEGHARFLRGASVADNIPEADVYLDAIDALNPKVNLIAALLASGRPFLSVLGTAGRRDPTRLQVADIWSTHGCPLGYFVRKRLRKQGIDGRFPVIFSPEPPVEPVENPDQRDDGKGRIRRIQGSTPFVPQAAGHIAAWWLVEKLLSSQRGAS